jgi:D-alanine-D-alanine ligase
MNIAIVYCAADHVPPGRELELIADCEVTEVAAAVKWALESCGHTADILRINPECLELLKSYDWIFNLAESVCGFPFPDYEIARRMEELGLRFTGSGSATLKTCLDKAETKVEILRHGILTPAFEVIAPGEPVQTELPFPLFVKPVHEDGSIGIFSNSVIQNLEQLQAKVAEIHETYQQAALVEEYIEGRDITASILGNGAEAKVLPLSELVYGENFDGPKVLTYEAKWLEQTPAFTGSLAVCPCSLNPQTQELIAGMARSIYLIMGCEDYARVDFRLRGRTPYLLEVNPNPCINPHDSGFIRASTAAGMDYQGVIRLILEHSIQKNAIPIPARHTQESLWSHW